MQASTLRGAKGRTVLLGPLQATGRKLEFESTATGVLTIASLLKSGGFDASSVPVEVDPEDRSDREIVHELTEGILRHRPDVVGFSVNCGFFALTLLTAKVLREKDSQVTIALGGPHPSALWREVLEVCSWIDAVVVGEAELTAVPIWRSLGDSNSMMNQPGLAHRIDGVPHLKAPAPLIKNADMLPHIDWSLVPKGVLEDPVRLELEAGRGCPHSCLFCSTSRFWGRQFRIKNPSRLIEDMEAARAATGCTRVSLVHDLITVSREWIEEFCRQLEQNETAYSWSCSTRVDNLDQDLMKTLAGSGCNGLFLGTESGSKRVRWRIGKNWREDSLMDSVITATGLGMNLDLSFIFGFPFEEKEDLLETLRVALKARRIGGHLIDLLFHVLAPLPDSPMYDSGNWQLDLDPYGSPTMEYYSFEAPMCREFIKNHPELCMASYHYTGSSVPRKLVLSLSLVMNNLVRCPATLRVLDRIYGDSLPGRLLDALELFRPEKVGNLIAQELLEGEIEGLLDEIMIDAAEGVPWWRDLYRYEAARLIAQVLPESRRMKGVVLDLETDAARLARSVLENEELPESDPAPKKLSVWCYDSSAGQRRAVIPRSLADSL